MAQRAQSAGRRRRDGKDEKASEWLAQAHQLNSKRKALAKDRDLTLHAMKAELEREVIDMEDEERGQAKLRGEEAAMLMRQLHAVKDNVQGLRTMIESRGTGDAYLDRLRKTMDDVEGELWLAGDGQRETMEQLLAEEKKVTQELEEMERYFNACMAEGTAPAAPRPQTAREAGGEEGYEGVPSRVHTAVASSDLPPEVLAVERMLQEEGGSTGGWDDRDHERFLKHRTQHPGRPDVYIARTADDLHQDHDVASVEQHERWYVRFQALLQAKRDAIRTWRSNKKHSGGGVRGGGDDGGGAVAQRARPQTAQARAPAVDREEQKQQLAAWRAQRDKEKREREEKAAKEEADKRAKDNAKRKQERAVVRAQVKNYHEGKSLEKEVEQLRAEVQMEAAKPRLTVEQLQRIQERNQHLTQERQLAMRRKEQEDMAKQQRVAALLEQSAFTPEVQRDRSRLTTDTMSSGSRKQNHLMDLDKPRQEGYYAIMRPATVSHMPQRATPSWRAGV